MDYVKRIEQLETRIKQLEQNITLFGRSYSQIGNSDSDILMKTKGQVKIQWGNKFIDLIKDGKINVETKFIFSGDVGTKEGIYVLEDGSVYLKVKDKDAIPLIGEIGTTYVSFLGQQDTSSDSKYTALKNIGFLYPDIESITDNSIQNGIIYIESEQKLYIVKNGELSEYSIQIPNPYTKQFVIAKDDQNIGALVIKGGGIANSLAFDSLYIFTEDGMSYLRSNNDIIINISDYSCITISENKTSIKNPVESNTFRSINGSVNRGFILYTQNDESTLIVDNLIVRNQAANTQNVYPVEWSLKKNIITSIDGDLDNFDNEYSITLKYKNEYNANDQLFIYGKQTITYEESGEDDSQDVQYDTYIRIPIQVQSVNSNTLQVKMLKEFMENVPETIPDCIGSITYLISSTNNSSLIRNSGNNIDIIKCQNIEDELKSSSVQARLGDLTELALNFKNDSENVPIKGDGLFSKQGAFLEAGYVSNYNLSEDDSSSRFASTEWINNRLSKLPKPGYYWSEEKDSKGQPIDPQFIGTDAEGFVVSAEQPYLWKTLDGKVYTLVSQYIYPSSTKIYIVTTGKSDYEDRSIGTHYSFPAGFIAYYHNNTLIHKLGQSNYLPIHSTQSSPDIEKITSIIQNPDLGIVPELSGYKYCWSIEANQDLTVYSNWNLEYSFGEINSIQLTINSDWGNRTAPPGYIVVEVDNNNRVTSFLSDTQYINQQGTFELWKNEVWRSSFLKAILADFLNKNKDNYYLPNLGWNFNWNGVVNCFGYGGVWNGRISGQNPPTSDDPSKVEYLPTSGFTTLSGYVLENKLLIHFEFTNVKIGMQLPYSMVNSNISIGDIVSQAGEKYYNVSYDHYRVVIRNLTDDIVLNI